MQRKRTVFAIAVALVGNALGVSAQETKERRSAPPPDGGVVVITSGQDAPPQTQRIGAKGDTFVFVESEMSFDGKVIKGAPYSAQAVTETVQTLGDGNRIVRKTTAQVYRDSEGRTRRDQTLGTIGPYAAAGDPPQTFFINDPVSGVSYILDPASKVARKLPRIEFNNRIEKGAAEKEIIERKLSTTVTPPPGAAKEEAHSFVFTTPAPPPDGPAGPNVQFFAYKMADSKTEKLESRNIEGVQAEGTRTTETIPAGEIGNEQPIQIVNERWYSPELQIVVMTRHSDPRFGETTYKLMNIQRGEPSPALFQVPSDYTVKEGVSFRRTEQQRMRRPEAPTPPEN